MCGKGILRVELVDRKGKMSGICLSEQHHRAPTAYVRAEGVNIDNSAGRTFHSGEDVAVVISMASSRSSKCSHELIKLPEPGS